MRIMRDGEVIEVADPETPADQVLARSQAVAQRLGRAAEIPLEFYAFFYERFTDTERLAVQVAAAANPQIALGLTYGLAKGSITLADATVVAWMAALVAAGAVTAQRSAEILTP